MLHALVNVISPVVLVAAMGALLGRRFDIDLGSLNKVGLYVFTPALAYVTVVTTQVSAGAGLHLVGTYVATIAAAAAVAAAAARVVLGPGSGGRTGLVVGGTILGNNGNFGLPIALLALGKAGLDEALVIFIVSLTLIYTAGPALLGSGGGLLAGVRRVLLLPVTWLMVAGLIVRGAGWTTPAPLMTSIALLANAAIPLVLVTLGLQLVSSRSHGVSAPVVLTVALRAFALPVIAYGVGRAAGLSGLSLHSLVLACAMPTAVNTYLIAREFGDDPAASASVVAWSTALSVPLIAVVVTILPSL